MRITGGLYRGRRIKCPRGVIRPAMDRMRESLFSILGPLDGCSFLDLFSGSGIIGIEAASRGAAPVILVEKDRIKKEVIYQNISFVETEIKPMIMPAEVYIRSCRRTFDYIFLDPPFPLGKKPSFIKSIYRKKILEPRGTLMIHFPREDDIPDVIEGFACSDTREYGRSILKFYNFENGKTAEE